MKKIYSAACALLGISVFRKIYQELTLLSSADSLKMYYALSDHRVLLNFGLVNFVLLSILLVPRFVRWLLFGNALDHREIASIREKFNYTLFEFVWGLVILKNIDREALKFSMVMKYASLFGALVLTKSFHYLCDLRVASQIMEINNGSFQQKSSIKLLLGILTLISVDLLVLFKVKDDISKNSLSMIFGYEVLNLLPLILLTLVNYATSVYMYTKNQSPKPSSYFFTLLEFTLNLIRMSLFIAYTWIFNQNFTFPVHMIPSSYRCFRLLLTKTRSLVVYKRNLIRFEKYEGLKRLKSLDDSSNDTCFCLEELTTEQEVRQLCCQHAFHYECLKWWLVKSETCPICRDKVHFHDMKQQRI